MTGEPEYQLHHLRLIFHRPFFVPIFKPNPKYCIGDHENVGGYIALSDLKNQRVIVRVAPLTRQANPTGQDNWFADEMTQVLHQYDSIEDLVNDGWVLDWSEPERETDRDYQIRHLSNIYRDKVQAAVFKPNPKYSPKDSNPAVYSLGDVEDAARGYIDLSDITNGLYIVRDARLDGAVIQEYASIEKLVDDGWRLV